MVSTQWGTVGEGNMFATLSLLEEGQTKNVLQLKKMVHMLRATFYFSRLNPRLALQKNLKAATKQQNTLCSIFLDD